MAVGAATSPESSLSYGRQSIGPWLQGRGGTWDAGRRTLGAGPIGVHHPYLSEAAAPMVVGATISRWRPSPLVVNLDDLDAGRVRSAEARGAGKT